MIEEKPKPPEFKAVPERPKPDEILYDLGCGDNKQPGYLGVDKYETPSTDQLVDLLEFPWPWRDESVDGFRCSHFFEHIPAGLRKPFMEEVWRCLRPGRRIEIICPFWASERAYQDYTHEWPPITRASFNYFNRRWLEQNKLTHGAYETFADFEVQGGEMFTPDWECRSDDAKVFAKRHYVEVVPDVVFSLVKIGAIDAEGKGNQEG